MFVFRKEKEKGTESYYKKRENTNALFSHFAHFQGEQLRLTLFIEGYTFKKFKHLLSHQLNLARFAANLKIYASNVYNNEFKKGAYEDSKAAQTSLMPDAWFEFSDYSPSVCTLIRDEVMSVVMQK